MNRIRAGGLLRTFEDESMNLLTRFTTNATGARCVIIDDTIRQLKAAGVWGKLDCFYMLAAAASDQALLNWKGTSFSCTVGGTITFTADRGYAGNGTDGRLDTGFNPTTAPTPFYGLNSASIGVYSRTNTNAQPAMGNENSFIIPRNSGNTWARLNRPNTITATNANGSGYFHAFRVASGEFRTRSRGVTTLTATASTADANQNIWICAYNAAAPAYGTLQISHAYIGGGLTEAEVIALEDIVTSHLARIGAAV